MLENDKITVGVLLLNLGGPDSIEAVQPFLYNLFSDREIIRLGPSFLQKPVARMISGLRSRKTREMYRSIGGKSPILDITMAQSEALEKALNQRPEAGESSPSFKVFIGMRYWHPFIGDAVRKVIEDGMRHVIVLSLYPHYSKATTGSAIAECKRTIARYRKEEARCTIQYIEQWYDFPPYIDALAEIIWKGFSEFRENLSPSPFSVERPAKPSSTLSLHEGAEGGPEDIVVLFSAHSLPEKLIREGDPYLDQIKATISAVNATLDARYSRRFKWHLAFQSRSGPVRWLRPSTDETIISLSREGVKNILVVPISFVSDHIETLYEIDVLYNTIALNHGVHLKRCRSLNTSERFIAALRELVLTSVGNAGCSQ